MFIKFVYSEGWLEIIYIMFFCVMFKFNKYVVSVCDVDLRVIVLNF